MSQIHRNHLTPLYWKIFRDIHLIERVFCVCLSFAACDKVCSGCTGAGPDKCQACASGYEDTEGTCTGMM